MFFEDRKQAGEILFDKLKKYKGEKDLLVLGIPRGGVPVAKVIAEKLNAPLDVIVSRKIGAPGQEELAIGAVGPNGTYILDDELISRLQAKSDYIEEKIEDKKVEVEERLKEFRDDKPLYDLKGAVVILVDDGIATGSTVKASISFMRKKGAKKIILAVPVAPQDSVDELNELADEYIALHTPKQFYAVGQFYRDFPQISNEEVVKLLN